MGCCFCGPCCSSIHPLKELPPSRFSSSAGWHFTQITPPTSLYLFSCFYLCMFLLNLPLWAPSSTPVLCDLKLALNCSSLAELCVCQHRVRCEPTSLTCCLLGCRGAAYKGNPQAPICWMQPRGCSGKQEYTEAFHSAANYHNNSFIINQCS